MNIAPSLEPPKVALIAGPTASGKSALALELAKCTGGTIINADSAQVYRDLRVLSARPTVAEEAQALHRLFGHVDGAQPYSAAQWAAEAAAAIDAAIAAGSLPILVGGTGMYLRTLIDGIAPVPDIPPELRAEVRALPVAAAHAELARLDPAGAALLRATDTTRVARALEVVRATGRPLRAWQADRVGGIGGRVAIVASILLPDRAWLAERCDRRLAAMFDGGAVDEVRALIARPDVAASAPARRAIGVTEIAEWLTGRIDRATALARAQAATRQYAKRQYTWFRHQPPPEWPRISHADPTTSRIEFERRLQI
ncbi:tRNA (adenosine(37)-N6)-dimethylallyltransferase MiaA [Sphingomonas sp. SFZ2018-12]|uniref:tRNA (adenosine(37)-N6)-dimethylallyltransferase MiaA n=1 Tax=Sphingomonas sp. SFZ2018-12 TaxID=2683197 RepID=UPI001F116EA9|nr:tRNA (adenosine(37)-N6)-dimethylallyltransferase MiaA [Sphingomonas sp. SFZ2018-12]MCH4892232.1 tRNA (adenosine(37)-N6)-dimethylallyltransferase MiaA [Sphingomonas sp. SFZ2018-12]